MKKSIILLLVDGRSKSAVDVQQLLTEWGCYIKTRLGIHDGVQTGCEDSGLIILEFVGKEDKAKELEEALNKISAVHAQTVHLSIGHD